MADNNQKREFRNVWWPPECWATPEFLPIALIEDEKFATFEWKKEDVVVVALPRSGTHLTWMITRMLVQGSAEPILDSMEASHVWLPSFKDTQTGRRVLNSHAYTTDVEESALKEGNRKFIYVSRNCKDVSVSQFNIFKKFKLFTEAVLPHNWEDYVPKFYNFFPVHMASESQPSDGPDAKLQHPESKPGNTLMETKALSKQVSSTLSCCWWVRHLRNWENYAENNPDVSILFLYFENIVRNFEENIRKIAAFLSLPLSDELLEGIMAACKFDNMKNAPVSENLGELWAHGMEKSFYRKGTIGDWKNWYTVAQNELADEFLAKEMKGSRYAHSYE